MSEGVSLGKGRCIDDSGRALRIEFTDGEHHPMWIPQSQIHADSEVYKEGHEGNVVITLWWAGEHGLV